MFDQWVAPLNCLTRRLAFYPFPFSWNRKKVKLSVTKFRKVTKIFASLPQLTSGVALVGLLLAFLLIKYGVVQKTPPESERMLLKSLWGLWGAVNLGFFVSFSTIMRHRTEAVFLLNQMFGLAKILVAQGQFSFLCVWG